MSDYAVVDKESSVIKIVIYALKFSFLFALLIEFLKLFLKLGTFQLSDLFFDTIGGGFGGLIFYVWSKITSRWFEKEKRER